ncbi:MAG: Npt1/Npt2 family nucleotide transporter [Chloroflexota bacterium]
MKEKTLKLLNLRPGEWRLVLMLWFLLAVNMIVQELSDVVATAGFVSSIGARQVPWLWVVTTVINIFAAAGYGLLVDRFPRLKLITWLLIGLAGFYLSLQVMFTLGVSDKITYPSLYILADQQFGIMPLAFWALANDVYSISEARRIFPIIASGAVIGGLAGNGLAAVSGVILERTGGSPAILFSITAVLLVGTMALLRLVFRKRVIRARQSRDEDNNLRESITLGIDYFTNVPMLKMAGIAMLCIGVTLTLVEYHFLQSIEQWVTSDLQFQSFLGIYKAIQMGGLLLFQWLITGRLLQKIPLKNAFLVLPAALAAAGSVALGLPGLIGAAISRFVARTVYVAWDEPARKSLQGLVPDERRGRISTFMDSYFGAFATLFGCFLLIILLGTVSVGWLGESVISYIYLGVALATAVGSLLAGLRLRKVYDQSLLNWRLARSKRKSVLDGIDF